MTREEFENGLLHALRNDPQWPGCLGEVPPDGRPIPRIELSRLVEEARGHRHMWRAAMQLGQARAATRRANPVTRAPQQWSTAWPDPWLLAEITRLRHLVPLLASEFTELLWPLLTATARRQRPGANGSRLDLHRQAARVFLQAQHGAEHAPPIWIDQTPRARQPARVQCVLLLDCSRSMLEDAPRPAAAAHVAAAALLAAAQDLDGLIEIAIAGFTDEVLVLRGFDDDAPLTGLAGLLAHAQAIGQGTNLAPALTWATQQFARVEPDRRTRRLLLIITDAQLSTADAFYCAAPMADLAEDVLALAIHVGVVEPRRLRKVLPAVVSVPPDRLEQLPSLVRQLLEDVIRQDRVLV